jgi:hypothetical protein
LLSVAVLSGVLAVAALAASVVSQTRTAATILRTPRSFLYSGNRKVAVSHSSIFLNPTELKQATTRSLEGVALGRPLDAHGTSLPSGLPPEPSGNPPGRATEVTVQSLLTAELRTLAGTNPAPSGRSRTVVAIELAVADLGNALNPSLWSRTQTDGNHVDSGLGGQVFQHNGGAVGDLMSTGPNTPDWAMTGIGYIEYATRLLASTAILDNSCNARDDGRIHEAEADLMTGDGQLDQHRYDVAVDSYHDAWRAAEGAEGSSCGGGSISVTPLPTLFNVVDMAPGDHAAVPVTLTVSGHKAGEVVMYTQHLVSTTCAENNLHCPAGTGTGALANKLNLTIFDTTTGLTLYSGLLSSLPMLPASLTICAEGSTSATGSGCKLRWNVNERHTLTFTVAFPPSGGTDNAFQGTGTSVQLVWGRSDCAHADHGCGRGRS